MLKNLTIHRLGPTWAPHGTALEDALAKAPFVPCAPTEPVSSGWVPPRGAANAALVESVGGQWLMRLAVEQRALPASVVRRRLDDESARIEKTTGRKPGWKQKLELKEQIVHELLPRAFTKQAAVNVWLDPKRRLLMLDATGQGRIDRTISALVDAAPELAPTPIGTTSSPAVAMADWLASGEPPEGFDLDRECELKAGDDSGGVVRYARHPLDIAEVRDHIAAGKMPKRLALVWQGRVAFTLTDLLQLRRIAFLDGVFDGKAPPDEGFDADAAITTGELGRLIPDLLDALGGEQQPSGAAPLAA